MAKENYKKRMEHFRQKALKRGHDSAIYWQVVEVYQHLIECNLTHSGANPTCRWNANGVEK